MSSRIAHHIDFPDYSEDELLTIAELMLEAHELPLRREAAREAFGDYLTLRACAAALRQRAHVRNALDRARLRQASRLFAGRRPIDAATLSRIEAEDIAASRVFAGGLKIGEAAS